MEQSVALPKSEQTKELGLKPTLVKDVVLISPGIWTGIDNQPTNYSPETIRHGFENTDWSNMNLFLDHKDSHGPAVGNWAGFIRNVRMLGSDLIGDVEVWHPMISMFIKDAKAKFAVSMTTSGAEKILSSGIFDYEINRFESFSMVHDPGCKISWLPKTLASGEETKTVISSSIGVNKELADSSDEKVNPKEKSDSIKLKKEVKKMKEEKTEEKAVEEKVEKKEEAVEDKKELSEARESESVKSLSVKVDAISNGLKELTSAIKELSANEKEKSKELAEGEAEETETEESEEAEESEESEEDKTEENDSKKELAETKEALENTKKELAALKEDDSPDKKSLAVGGNATGVDDVNSVNYEMIGFLRENANLNY